MPFQCHCRATEFSCMSDGNQLPANLAFAAALTNGTASWEQLRGGERSQLSSPRSAESASSCVILSSSRNADSISSDRTTNLFPSSRCVSATKMVLPLESIVAAQPQIQPALLSLSAIVSQYRFTAAFPRRVFGNADRSATDPRADRALKVPA